MENKQKNGINLIPFKNPFIQFNRIILYLKKLLNRKYFVDKTEYEKIMIKNLIYDERNRLVSKFKDLLIINDRTEFLKRYYTYKESLIRLKKYYEFYTNYSKLFPNYIPLYESKYIYKNIHKKQKIIDIQNNERKSKEKEISRTRNNKIFGSEIYGSIAKNTENLNSAIFGMHKDEQNNHASTSQILNIINSIDKCEVELEQIEQQQSNQNKNFRIYSKYDKDLKNKNIINNNFYYNNSSILTKQSTIPSIITQQKKNNNTNEKKFSIISSNILIGLKKKKKKLLGVKNNINNSTTFKNLKSYGLINNNNDDKNKSIYVKKSRYIAEDTYSLANSSKNNNNKSINNANNSNSNNNNINNSNIFKNNIQKYTKYMPYTSRVYPTQNKKLIDAMSKLIDNCNVKNHSINNKSNNISSSGNINKKKINYLLTKKIFHYKTNYLSDRTSHYFSHIKNSQNNKQCKYSANIRLKKNSKNYRNNSDNNKSKNYIKIINKNIITKKSTNNYDTLLQNRLNALRKQHKLKNITSKLLYSHISTRTHSNNLSFQKPIKNKIKIENLNIATEREYINKKNLNDTNINHKLKINQLLNDKIKRIRKNNSNIKNINNFKNIKKLNKNNKNIIQLFNESDYITNVSNPFITKGNTTIMSNLKLNMKYNKFINKNKLKKQLLINQDINKNKELLLYKNFYSTDNSLNYSSNETGKDIKKELNSGERIKNLTKYINIYHQNDNNNNLYEIDINKNNNIKKASVIKIKGIQIKNFNKIINENKEKSKSNSSKKNKCLNYKNNKILIKIPKDNKKTNIGKINENTKIKRINHIINKNLNKTNYNNSIFNYFPKSLTERNNLYKSKKI